MFLPHPATPVSSALTPKQRAHQSTSATVSVEESKTTQTDEGGEEGDQRGNIRRNKSKRMGTRRKK